MISKYDYPRFMSFDKNRGTFIVRGPDGKKKRFTDEAEARATALALADYIADRTKLQALNQHMPTLGACVDAWLAEREQHYAAKGTSKYNQRVKMLRIKRELGHLTVREIRPKFLEDWMNKFCHKGDTFIKWRLALVRLFAHAVSQDWVQDNAAEKVQVRSGSKLLTYNHTTRTRLDREAFLTIHEAADPWLQLAMELSLITGQGRYEICNMKHADFRDGRLFVIREKVAGQTDASRIKIAITPEMEEIRKRSLRLMGNMMSPYLVHRTSDRQRKSWTKAKGKAGKHETYVIPDYLTKAFAEVRDRISVYDHLDNPEQRPSFHEIRSLASRLRKDKGVSKEALAALNTHADISTTDIYLQDGAKALTDDDYLAVEAPLSMAVMLS